MDDPLAAFSNCLHLVVRRLRWLQVVLQHQLVAHSSGISMCGSNQHKLAVCTLMMCSGVITVQKGRKHAAILLYIIYYFLSCYFEKNFMFLNGHYSCTCMRKLLYI